MGEFGRFVRLNRGGTSEDETMFALFSVCVCVCTTVFLDACSLAIVNVNTNTNQSTWVSPHGPSSLQGVFVSLYSAGLGLWVK